MSEKKFIPFNANTPEAAAHRYAQAHVSCDIEGMARDPELDGLHEKWTREGVPVEEQIERLKALANQEGQPSLAAE